MKLNGINMKQTAVEWLIEQMQTNDFIYGDRTKIIEQAKELEKEQIIDAANLDKRNYDNAEQYYTETYETE